MEDTVYRVWMKTYPSDGRAYWFPVSQTFNEGHNADIWAKGLNTDEYRVEEEEA